jgi:hypothetical protein
MATWIGAKRGGCERDGVGATAEALPPAKEAIAPPWSMWAGDPLGAAFDEAEG